MRKLPLWFQPLIGSVVVVAALLTPGSALTCSVGTVPSSSTSSSFAVKLVAPDDRAGRRFDLHMNIAGNESDRPCTFVQNGNDLTGTCPSERGEAKLTGEVKDKKVTWSYKTEYEGTPITVKYDGKLESATKITGTVNVAEFNADGDFTATLSK